MKKIDYPDERRKRGTRGNLCSRCGVEPRVGPTDAYCKSCRTLYNAERASIRKVQIAKSNGKRYLVNDDIIVKAKSVPCMDCGNSYPWYVMDFDHVRGKKTSNISAMRTCNTPRLLEEIEKCDVVCSNCHRFRTYSRL